MEANKEEALKAIQIAENRFAQRDFAGAKSYAVKAKKLCPGLEGIPQMVATFEVYVASEAKFNGETDYYSVLSLNPSADRQTVKRHYKKMAMLLHPDKNKCVGADGAFKLVSEAWNLLSDRAKRSSYDLKRNAHLASGFTQTYFASVHSSDATSYNTRFNLSTRQVRLDSFWTICTSCNVQYEYLRKYMDKTLSCKNCRGTFIAVETGAPPANGSFSWSCMPSNGFGNHSYDGAAYVPNNVTFCNGNGFSGYHSGHGYDYFPNASFQWTGTPAGVICQNGQSTMSADSLCFSNGSLKRGNEKVNPGSNRKPSVSESTVPTSYTMMFANDWPQEPTSSKPDKRRKVVLGATFRNVNDEKRSKSASQVPIADGNTSAGSIQKPYSTPEIQSKQYSTVPAFDARKMLIEKARTEIWKKLEEMKLASVAATAVRSNDKASGERSEIAKCKIEVSSATGASIQQLEPWKTGPISINVPDSDFHNFDNDRLEECFKPKQIWALYDEEEGMPRLYCIIREVISLKPFNILVTYLNSKSDTEFGLVNWLSSGFTKSCGHFRSFITDDVDQVNIFSHVLSREKAGRGGCVRIYPRSGDVWAVYRNWSPDWDSSTPDEVKHHYEMVEILDDYYEEIGISVALLVKLAGYKTVYGRNTDKHAVRWIPKSEMLRFSHQVPSWLLTKEASNLPGKCWDLDPAATPDELLHSEGKAT